MQPVILKMTDAQRDRSADWIKHANPKATEEDRQAGGRRNRVMKSLQALLDHEPVHKAFNVWHFNIRPFLAPGTRAQCYAGRNAPRPISKAAGDKANTDVGEKASPKELGFTPKPKYTKADLKAMGMRWITAHPGGPGSEGVNLLVAGIPDEEGAYAVVGGAGGNYNFTVLRPEGGDFKDVSGKKKPPQPSNAPDLTDEQRQELEQKRGAVKAQKKEVHSALKEALSKHVKDVTDEDKANVRAAAEKQAREKLGPDATDEQLKEHADQAEKEMLRRHAEVQQRARDRIMRLSLQHSAEREHGNLTHEKVQVDAREDTIHDELEGMADQFGGEAPERRPEAEKKLLPSVADVKSVSADDLKEIGSWAMQLESVKKQERALSRALKTGDQATIRAAMMDVAPLEGAELEAALSGASYEREKTDANHALIHAASKAGTRNQTQMHRGAAQAAAAITSEIAGTSILDNETVKQLGVAATSRLIAEYLKSKGSDAGTVSKALRTYIAENSSITAVATMQEFDRLNAKADELAKSAAGADGEGERLLTSNQVNAKRLKFTNEARELAAMAMGQLETAAQAALHLDRNTQGDLIVSGRETEAATASKTADLGLLKRDYRISRGDHGWQLHIKPAAFEKLYHEQPFEAWERDAEIARIKDDVRVNGDTDDEGRAWRAKGQAESIILAPHQQANIQLMEKQKTLLIGDEVGAGKSATAILSATHLAEQGKVKKCVIVVPLSVAKQFGEETKKFADPKYHDSYTVPKDAAARKAAYSDDKLFTVVTHDSIRNDKDAIKAAGIDMIVIDEAHYLSARGEATAERTKALQEIKPEYRMMMTGTATKSGLDELHSLIEYLHPGLLGDRKEFMAKYGRLSSSQGAFDKPLLRSLQRRLDSVMVGTKVRTRTVKDGKVEFVLPPGKAGGQPITLRQHTVNVEISPQQRTAYAAKEKDYLAARKEIEALRAKGEKIPQALATRGQAFSRDRAHNQTVNNLDMDDHPKVAALKQIMGKHSDQNGIVFAENTYSHETIKKGLGLAKGEYMEITGSTRGDDRSVIKKLFNGEALDDKERRAASRMGIDPDKPPKLLLASDAANFGLNLTGGSWGVNYDIPDTHATVEQRIGREHRNGQTRDVDWYHLVANAPTEIVKQENVKKKESGGLLTSSLYSVGDESALGKAAFHARPVRTEQAAEPAAEATA